MRGSDAISRGWSHHEQPAEFHHDAGVGDLQRAMRVLLDHQHGQAAVAQLGDGLEDLVLVAGRQAERGLVEQEELGPGLQHHRGFQDLLFAAAQIAGQHAELGREQREARQHLARSPAR